MKCVNKKSKRKNVGELCINMQFLPIYNYKKHKKSKVLTKQYFFNYDL